VTLMALSTNTAPPSTSIPTLGRLTTVSENALAQKGDLDGAIREYRAALNLNPNIAVVHNALGGALAQKGDLDGAIREFREALSLDPHLAIAHDNLERVLHAKSGASVSGGSTEP
jgi:Flp pilus assembly protein TadD